MAKNGVSTRISTGKFPEFGAIFMANRTTMDECFERKLFGLPHTRTDFVKNVKSGMVLFLFEYEQRRLYGVFQAVSDGSINIVPHAYLPEGKQFSAQVQFSVIWNCRPLPENAFRDAIRSNYFAANKFNFGLSEDQVRRLLWLFESQKVRIQTSIWQNNIKRSLHKYSDKVNSGLDSGKFGVGKENDLVEGQPWLSSRLPRSLDSAGSNFRLPLMIRANKMFTSQHEFARAESVPSHKEQELFDIPLRSVSMDFGDYIPLSSPEHSDLARTGDSSIEAGKLENNQIEPATFDCYKDSYPSEEDIVPMLGYKDLSHPSVGFSSDRDHCHGKSRSDLGHQSDNCQWIKGLYSDTSNNRISVFSRLNLVLRPAVQKSEDNAEVKVSTLEIMKKLLQMQCSWKKTIRKAKHYSHYGVENVPNKRASVFSRLNFAPKCQVQAKDGNTKLNKPMDKITERFHGETKMQGPSTFTQNDDDGKNFSVTVKEEIKDAFYDEEHSKDTWSMESIEEQNPFLNSKSREYMLKTGSKN